jgi:hypothetical protein
LIKDTDYRFVRLKDSDEWSGIKAHEEELLKGLFGAYSPEKEVLLSDLKNEFYQTLVDIKNDLFRELKEAGFYRHRPDKVLGAFIAVGVVSLGLSIPGFLLLAQIFMTSPLSAGIAGVLFALPILGFGILMPARTVKGTRVLEEILGFQEFLDRVESDRYKRMITSPQMFEEFLPFAMALGVEEKWAQAFEGIYKEPPGWYVGRHPHAFHTAILVSNLSAMTSQAGTVMTSAGGGGGAGAEGAGGVAGEGSRKLGTHCQQQGGGSRHFRATSPSSVASIREPERPWADHAALKPPPHARETPHKWGAPCYAAHSTTRTDS